MFYQFTLSFWLRENGRKSSGFGYCVTIINLKTQEVLKSNRAEGRCGIEDSKIILLTGMLEEFYIFLCDTTSNKRRGTY